MRNASSILVALVLFLSAVSTSWCVADCAAKALSPKSCHHQETVKVCDDPTTVVPDAALQTPTLSFGAVVTTFIAWTPSAPSTVLGIHTPRPPLRL